MPPVTSQPVAPDHVSTDGLGRLAAPFVGRPTIAAPTPPVADTPAFDDAMPWEGPAEDEGTVEPVFEADVSETAAVLAELSASARREEEFPLDAFIIPEQAHRVPTGLEGKPLPEHKAPTPVTELADRLEKLSHRLRVEDSDAVLKRLAAGDKLDALLAGLIAGLIAGSK